MARNIEIKARVSDFERVAREVKAFADSGPEVLEQEDTFFYVSRGRLKLRVFGDLHGELIFYERPDEAGPKLSEYYIVPVSDSASLKALLGRALGVIGTVRKKRTLFLSGRTRIHLDEVEGLGSFLELEVVLSEGEGTGSARAEARALLARLGVADEDLVQGAYIDLIDRP